MGTTNDPASRRGPAGQDGQPAPLGRAIDRIAARRAKANAAKARRRGSAGGKARTTDTADRQR